MPQIPIEIPEIIPNWHPIFVHITIGALTLSLLFYFLAWLGRRSPLFEQWLAAARWTLWTGAVFAIVTAYFGWRAFNTVEHDEAAHEVMIEHRNLALATIAVAVVLVLWSLLRRRVQGDMSWGFRIVLLIAFGLLVATGWHGGELVYRHGLGVISLPAPGEHHHGAGHMHEHAHEHGDEHAHEHAVPAAGGASGAHEEDHEHSH